MDLYWHIWPISTWPYWHIGLWRQLGCFMAIKLPIITCILKYVLGYLGLAYICQVILAYWPVGATGLLCCILRFHPRSNNGLHFVQISNIAIIIVEIHISLHILEYVTYIDLYWYIWPIYWLAIYWHICLWGALGCSVAY